MGLTADSSLRTDRANFKLTWHKKTRPNIKNPDRKNSMLCPSLRISGQLPAPTVNGRGDSFLKMEGFPTLKGSWPSPWQLTLDRVILHTVVHHSSTSTYMPDVIEIEETFCARTIKRNLSKSAFSDGCGSLWAQILGRWGRRLQSIYGPLNRGMM